MYERTIVNQLRIVRQTEDRASFSVRLFASPGSNSIDLNLTRQVSDSVEEVDYTLYNLKSLSLENLDVVARDVFVFSQDVPESVQLPEGQNEITLTWTTTIGFNVEESLAEFTEVIQHRNDLVKLHTDEWERFWTESGVTVEGNDDLAQTIHSSLYSVASALPTLKPKLRSKEVYYGISPAGLSNDLYQGRTLWDTEIWIQPVALLLEPKWSENLLEYRFVKRNAAAQNSVRQGFAGLLYPVESAESGDELSWNKEIANYKHHVSGDVSFAIKQHLFATSDTEWFKRVGCELSFQTAKFWENRTTYNNETDRYDISGNLLSCFF